MQSKTQNEAISQSQKFKIWTEKRRLETPLVNNDIIGRCLYALLSASYDQNNEKKSPAKKLTNTHKKSIKSWPKHYYRKTKHLKIRRIPHRHNKKVQNNQKGECEMNFIKNMQKYVDDKFSRLENQICEKFDKITEKFNQFEEKYDKENLEQRSALEYLHKEICAFKGIASNTQGYYNQIPLSTNTMPIREDVGKATCMVNCTAKFCSISEKSENAENCESENSEPDPLEELLNHKNSKGFGIKFSKEKPKNTPQNEDPILALLMGEEQQKTQKEIQKSPTTKKSTEKIQGKENLEVKAKTDIENAKPKTAMFLRMNKGKSTNNPAAASMDDLLFGT